MIIFAFLALSLVTYNATTDKKTSDTKTTKQVYEKMKKERK